MSKLWRNEDLSTDTAQLIESKLSGSLFLVIVSTAVRVYRKAFWLVRIVETPHGSRFILPNAICGYLIFNGIFLSLSIPYVRLCKEWVHIGADLSTNFLVSLIIIARSFFVRN